MHYRDLRAGADLHHATDITGADDIGFRRFQRRDLQLFQLAGDRRLQAAW
jgi:hypothetical protein